MRSSLPHQAYPPYPRHSATLSIRMRAVVLASALLLVAESVSAHPAPFSYLDLKLADDGVSGSLILHDFDVAHDVGVDQPEQLKDPAFAARYRDMLTPRSAKLPTIGASGL